MTKNIEELLELTTDIEALLLLIAKREKDTPKHVWEKLQLKADIFHQLLSTSVIEANRDYSVSNPTTYNVSEEEQTADESIIEEIEPTNNTAIINDERLRVDELLQRQSTKDLRKAFTLNDKFRFCRELFGNNEASFIDTIDLLSAMPSLDEALEYIYQDLKWEKGNEVTEDFVTVITNHFNARNNEW